MSSLPSQVLFICTGNYYRSRFAQALFNFESQNRDIHWEAFSRGLELHPGINHGPISVFTERELIKLGIPMELAGLEPTPLTREDLERADISVALKRDEHRPMMERKFPDFVDRVDYWQVHDLDFATPDVVLKTYPDATTNEIAKVLKT